MTNTNAALLRAAFVFVWILFYEMGFNNINATIIFFMRKVDNIISSIDIAQFFPIIVVDTILSYISTVRVDCPVAIGISFDFVYVDARVCFNLKAQTRIHPLHLLYTFLVVGPEQVCAIITNEESVSLLAPTCIKELLLISEEDGFLSIDIGSIEFTIVTMLIWWNGSVRPRLSFLLHAWLYYDLLLLSFGFTRTGLVGCGLATRICIGTIAIYYIDGGFSGVHVGVLSALDSFDGFLDILNFDLSLVCADFDVDDCSFAWCCHFSSSLRPPRV